LKKDCSALKDQCNKIKGCALLADGNCKEFTKCSDYTVSNIGQCQYKDPSCTEDVQTGAIWSCKTGVKYTEKHRPTKDNAKKSLPKENAMDKKAAPMFVFGLPILQLKNKNACL